MQLTEHERVLIAWARRMRESATGGSLIGAAVSAARRADAWGWPWLAELPDEVAAVAVAAACDAVAREAIEAEIRG